MQSPLYTGIDLHSNNNYIGIIDQSDQKIFKKKLPNHLETVIGVLAPYKDRIKGIVVESTYNWYWLVDGLMDEDYRVHLANPAANEQYKGIKFSDDQRDAFWLAHLLRLGILKEGYVYPKESRPIRDLLRKRGQLVRQQTMNILSFQNLYTRNTGKRIKGVDVKKLTLEEMSHWNLVEELILAMQSNLYILQQLRPQIKFLEKTILSKVELDPKYQGLKTIDGIGDILSLTIMLETGDIGRFKQVGNYTSYCRCVSSERTSNGKKKGKGNSKNGNKYLNWAFVEAANHAIIKNEKAQRFYQRKKAKTNSIIATKALAHKLARASYFIIRDQVPFDENMLFST